MFSGCTGVHPYDLAVLNPGFATDPLNILGKVSEVKYTKKANYYGILQKKY